MTNRPKCWPLPDTIRANAAAAEALMPDLPEQFAALDVGLQQRLFRLLDLVAGMSHDEKVEVRIQANGLRRMSSTGLEFAEVLSALDSVVLTVDRLATPEVDGEPTGDLAERFLLTYAAEHAVEQEG